MREANDELAEFMTYASEQHAQLAGRFAKHVSTLQTVHADLLGIFKRVRALRGQLLARHPELAPELERLEAVREAALELERQQQQQQPPAAEAAASEAAAAAHSAQDPATASGSGGEPASSEAEAASDRLAHDGLAAS